LQKIRTFWLSGGSTYPRRCVLLGLSGAIAMQYVKQMGDERLTKVPADTKPYRDERDYDLLRRMEAGVGSRKVPRSRTRWAAA
jgi:hypothetical protein